MLSKFILFPFIITLLPVLAIFQNNVFEVRATDLLRPVILYIVVMAVILFAARKIMRKREAAPIIATVIGLLLYTYPLMFNLMYSVSPSVARHRLIILPWLLLTAVIVFAVSKVLARKKYDGAKINKGLNQFSVILLVIMVANCAFSYSRGLDLALSLDQQEDVESVDDFDTFKEKLASDASIAKDILGRIENDQLSLPDIYYIILDGYARNDILKSRFDFNNDPFEAWLQEKGFFVAKKSHSNYPYTHLSLTSTLNMDFIQNLIPDDFGQNAPSAYRKRFQYFTSRLRGDLVVKNRARELLTTIGYKVITQNTGYAITRRANNSLGVALFGPLTVFEGTVIRKSVAWPVFDILYSRYGDTSEEGKNYNARLLEELPALAAAVTGPKFVFYHLMAPHPPFCFDENGTVIPAHPLFDRSEWIDDVMGIPGYEEFIKTNYPRAIAGLNIRVKTALTALMDHTGGKDIIIVQSDHGSQLGFDPFEVSKTDVPERFAILNAVYLPPEYDRQHYNDEISAVNTFRALFNTVFEAGYSSLDNKAWYSIGDMEFTDVTEVVHGPIDQ